MITVTDKAAAEVRRLLDADKTTSGDSYLRVMVVGGGCSGMSYKLGFETKPLEAGDKSFEDKGVKIVIDQKSLLYLSGTELDFSDGLNGTGFTFTNPNAKRTCGCGTSFSV
ncbi:MAG: iron-sulfur cluster assembly accessory protein [Deltaproteobacteria bacterium]|nr:iron-sulfur cluster assembly accessory protein [Deltaproteobacteria bacterium]